MKQKLLTCIRLAVLVLLFMTAGPILADTSADLQQQIRDHESRIDALKKQAALYRASLDAKRRERLTLSNQIGILTDQIEQTKLAITTTQTQIETSTLQIRSLENSIATKQKMLDNDRTELAGLVRLMARSQNDSALKIVFTSVSFSSFTNQIKSLKTVQLNMTDLIDQVTKDKAALVVNKQDLETKRQELLSEADQLNQQQLSLQGQQDTKGYLLQATKSSEKKFEALLNAARLEQQSTESEMTTLEQQIRERLKKEGINTGGPTPVFIWPVPNNRGISAIFHDPDYPFRKVFEHTGIDIRAPQGTSIHAAASGYVAQARSGGSRGYGYVMIIHNGGVASVYGHVSKILVTQDSYVAQGQIIALSGGLPSTQGAGPFSTGAHLHFEVRNNGIPVNPVTYLP